MAEPYRVLIVEDDFRIADINRSFVEQAEDFTVVGMARSRAEALAWFDAHPGGVDLLLLDVFLPDVEGLALLWEIRRRHRDLDIVMVTAAREVETVEEALRGGVFDFLIKPVEATRVQKMLARFRSRRQLADGRRELSQEQLDHALSSLYASPGASARRALPKGIDALTLDTVLEVLRQCEGALTATELAGRIGSSRSTARRYLEHLVGEQLVSAEQSYGDVGRPQRQYRLRTRRGAA
ncbi:MAG TPA: response regulator [Noviherbaspirillum sp.]|nr:response regulator [Noviherbaspirillum sp.]